jgi:hypothetical protein
MSEKKTEAAPPVEFAILYETLRTPEDQATIQEVRAVEKDSAAVAEIARLTADTWPPFTTYTST